MIANHLAKTPRLGCTLLLFSLALLPACGPSSPKCVPVTGTVTLDGGKVPGPGFIYFTIDPTGNAAVARPGTASFFPPNGSIFQPLDPS